MAKLTRVAHARLKRRFNKKRIAVIGGGSWGTALVKMLLNNVKSVNWYLRSEDTIDFITEHKHNPKYLTYLTVDPGNIVFYSDIYKVIEESDIILFAIPSAFLKETLNGHEIVFNGKYVVSAIKGIIPDDYLTISEFFFQKYHVSPALFAIISGPSHAEEIAQEKLAYLTIASKRLGVIRKIAGKLESDYIRTNVSRDIDGIEYAGILKNIVAIASGICSKLNYGDNFQAVLVSNAIREIKRFLDRISRKKRQINSSAYLGDLLVTAYSQYSRNRNFGILIGKGYSVQSAKLEMNMIAEGYYAAKCVHELNQRIKADIPIIEMVYEILYEGKPAGKAFRELSETLH
jgi:glycerol-3-phosphate dehydrogenase (NAD(P)+)